MRTAVSLRTGSAVNSALNSSRPGIWSLLGGAAALFFGGFLAVNCLRVALVASGGEDTNSLASSLWPGHPTVLRTDIMLRLAKGSARRQEPSAGIMQQVRLLSLKEPLAVEPYAVKGAIALRDAKYSRAAQLLIAARQRDPRNRPVRFLLADAYLRQEKINSALQELIVLTHLSPEMTSPVAAMLAQYSRTPGAARRLKGALTKNPQIENAVLLQLATDPANAQLILSLASRGYGNGQLLDWQQKLLSSSVEAGQFKTAWDLWTRFSREPVHAVGDFSDRKIASPFTWALTQSGEGSANSTPIGIDVDYFGRRDVSVASKLLTLTSGRYELRFRVLESSSDPSSLHWLVACLPSGSELANFALPKSKSGPVSFTFEVPVGCEGQRVELKGFAQVYPTEVALSIADFQVRRLP